MQLNRFFNIIKNRLQKINNKKVEGTTKNSEYDDLFLRFIIEEKFENAELMLSNNFLITPNILKSINHIFLKNLYSFSGFDLLDPDIINSDYIINSSDKSFTLNQFFKFLIKNDLLTLDFLLDTQKTSSIFIEDKKIKEILSRTYELDYRTAKQQAKYEYFGDLKTNKLKKTYQNKLSKLDEHLITRKKHYADLCFSNFNNHHYNNISSPNIFTSSVSFKEPITKFSNEYEEQSFSSFSSFQNHLPLKEVCTINFDDIANEETLFEKIPKLKLLTPEQLKTTKEILQSNYLTNFLFISQISRHIIEQTVEKNKMAPEEIINSIIKFSEPKSSEKKPLPIKNLIFTVGFLYPSCLKKLDKSVALDILNFIEEITPSFNYRRLKLPDHQISFQKLFTELKEDIDGTTLKNKHDDDLLQNFIKNNKHNILETNYVKLAQSFKLNQNILDELTNIKNISEDILINLKKNQSAESLEKQSYIHNTDKTIFNTIYEYSQFKDVLDSKNDMEDIYNDLLNKYISVYKEDLKGIMTYIHQENLKALSDNQKFIKLTMR